MSFYQQRNVARQHDASIASVSVLSSGLLRSSSLDSMHEWVLFSPSQTNASLRSREGQQSVLSVEDNEPLELPAHDGAGTFQERVNQWMHSGHEMDTPFQGIADEDEADEETVRPSLWRKVARSINGLFMDSNALDAMLASDWTSDNDGDRLSHPKSLEDIFDSFHYQRALNCGPAGWDDVLVKRILRDLRRDFPDNALVRTLVGRILSTEGVSLPPAPPLLEPHPVQLNLEDWNMSSTMSTTTAVF